MHRFGALIININQQVKSGRELLGKCHQIHFLYFPRRSFHCRATPADIWPFLVKPLASMGTALE